MNEVAIFICGQLSSLLLAAVIINWGSDDEEDHR